MRTERTCHPSRLGRDETGGILVVGIAAGLVLTYALLHMVHVTEAILWREGLQNAADAAAFDNAVLHARGMNTIAVLNIVMSVVMSVLLAWRIAEMLVAAAIVIVGIVSLVTGGAAASALPKLTEIESKLVSKDPKIADKVIRICAGINRAEKVVATVAPAYAMYHATSKTNADYPVDFAIALSPSVGSPTLVSNGYRASGFVKSFTSGAANRLSECRASQEKSRDFLGNMVDQTSQRRMGFLFSLPAQDDRLGTLCAQAGSLLDRTLPSAISGTEFQLFPDEVYTVKDLVFSNFPSLFCAPAQDGVKSLGTGVQNLLSKQVTAQCNKQKERFNGLSEEARSQAQFNKGGKFDLEECTKQAQKDADKKGNRPGKDAALNMQASSLACVVPAKVWESTQNGQLHMQSFSFAYRKSRGPDSSLIRAQAEMYFDCTGGWFDGCDSIAMWRPHWRARLRRIQPLSDMLLETVSVAASGAVANGIQSIVGELSHGVPVVGAELKFGNYLGPYCDKIQVWIQEHTRFGADRQESDLIH